MYCKNCGKVLNNSEKFCGNCGFKVDLLNNQMDFNSTQIKNNTEQIIQTNLNNEMLSNQNISKQTNENKQQYMQPVSNNITNNQIYNQSNYVENNSINLNKKSKNKFVFIGMGVVFILLILGFVFLTGNGDNKVSGRTFMIYMVGSDLESENQLASYDLEDIIPSNIDLKQNKVILMVGGSIQWHNYVDKNETSIYELKENGFEKVKTNSIQNMGDYQTLLELLNYSYNNYKTNEYHLIFWNHGLGASAFQYDTLSNDYLTLDEFKFALEKSPFNENNKMETMIFKNCLSGNIHFASVIDDYSKYMVASEEVSWASPLIDTLGFIEQIAVDDNGEVIGKKFIDNISPTIEDYYYLTDATYSVIDLSKIKQIETNLDSFVDELDLENDYNTISKMRSIIKQYGQEEKTFDTIDLYQFVYNLKSLSREKAEQLLDSIKSAVVYNRSKTLYSHGLAIYFPYNGTKNYIEYELNNLSKVDNSKYLNFITDFVDFKFNKPNIFWSSMNKAVSTSKSDFSLQLTEEEFQNYGRATFTVFRDMGEGYYMPMYISSDVSVSDSGLLTAQYKGNALKVIDTSDNSSETILLIEKSFEEKSQTYLTYAMLNSFNEKTNKFDAISANVYLKIDNKNPNGKIEYAVKVEKDAPSMSIIEIEDYSDLYFLNYKYKILDENGNYTENWESSGVAHMFLTGTSDSDYKFEISNLDDGYKYYCIFKIYDLKNEYHYSNLVQMQ